MKQYIYGIDIGGTTIKFGLFTTDYSLLQKWEIPTNTEANGKYVITDIVNEVKRTTPVLDQVLGYGFGVPGPVVKDFIHLCVNIGWRDVDLRKELSPLLQNANIRVGNDANVAALGEAVKGAGNGRRNVAMITLGTGIGSGIVVDGRLLEGHNGSAGEIGHLTVVKDHPLPCNCGKVGCLETVASATGIVNIYKRLKQSYQSNSILNHIPDPTTRDIFDAAKNNDELANMVVDEASYYIAYACHVLGITTNPSAIVIGGGVSKAGEFLLHRVRKEYKKLAFIPSANTEIVAAELGNDAGIFGAAGLVRQSG
jgi:glucokinase